MAFVKVMVNVSFNVGDIFSHCLKHVGEKTTWLKLLLFQYEYLFTPKMKLQLLWDRTINVHGRPGKNVSQLSDTKVFDDKKGSMDSLKDSTRKLTSHKWEKWLKKVSNVLCETIILYFL